MFNMSSVFLSLPPSGSKHMIRPLSGQIGALRLHIKGKVDFLFQTVRDIWYLQPYRIEIRCSFPITIIQSARENECRVVSDSVHPHCEDQRLGLSALKICSVCSSVCVCVWNCIHWRSSCFLTPLPRISHCWSHSPCVAIGILMPIYYKSSII